MISALKLQAATRKRAGERSKIKQGAEINTRSVHALAALLLLSQLPHVLHLPLWVSAVGIGIILVKLTHKQLPGSVPKILLSQTGMMIIALTGAVLVKQEYGYFLGRDPCVALLFILVSAKFAETRRSSDATILLCLCAFLLLTQYFYSQTILSALITLPAVLALGNALIVIRDPQFSSTTSSNIKLVGKLLLQGAPLAALLFFVFPRLPGPLWSLPNDAVATTGLSESMSPGTIGSLSLSDEVAFRVEFDGDIPPPEERYWRGPVMSSFDGASWSVSRQNAQVRPNHTSPVQLSYTVTLQPTNHNWLFALDHPTSLPMSDTASISNSRIIGRMTHDLQLLSAERVSRVIRYKQKSLFSDTYKAPRPPSSMLTQLTNRNPASQRFATKLRAASRSDRDYAQRVLRHFNEQNFRYTLEPSLLGDNPVDEFLFTTQNGFCEHYASAFVVLMRAAAIPARVVTGYLGGEMNGDYMIVRQSDAHAWAEAFIDGKWTRFDPTGAVAPTRVDTNMAAALPNEEPVPMMARLRMSWLKKLKLGLDEMNHDWQRLVVGFNNESQRKLWQKLGLPKLELWQITAIVLSLSAMWCIIMLGLPLTRKHQCNVDDKLWHQFQTLMERLGTKRKTSETPHQFIERAQNEHANNLITMIGHAIVKLRFEPVSPDEAAELRMEVKRNLKKLRAISLFNRGNTSTPQSSATT